MTPEEIDALIEAAGLSQVMTVFETAIEIHSYAQQPNGDWYTGYSALATLIAYAIAHDTSSSDK